MKRVPHLYLISALLLLLLLLPVLALGEGDCSVDGGGSGYDAKKAKQLKIAALFSILTCGGLGVCIPILGKRVRWLSPEGDVFFVVKAFAGGVILATGFIHILPDAFGRLTSPCLSPSPWQDFPFAGFTAMAAAIATLMIDTVATGFFNRLHFKNSAAVAASDDVVGANANTAPGDDVEDGAGADKHGGHLHMHTHATHGHAHGYLEEGDRQLIRHRVIAQVFELGIVVHSVIIGISVGASGSPSVIRPLMAALCFHQFFEGVGLGGCIVQAKFEIKSIVVMGLFFSLTTPIGVGIGMGISSVYNENSRTALIVEGLLDSASAGILIYMSLVDLLAQDFMNSRVQSKAKLQLAVNTSLLLGAGLMSLIAKWA